MLFLPVISFLINIFHFVCIRGGDIVTAAIAHLAHSTPPSNLFCSTDFNSYGPVKIAHTTAQRHNGTLAAPMEPGLGVDVIESVLGAPLIDVQ